MHEASVKHGASHTHSGLDEKKFAGGCNGNMVRLKTAVIAL